MDDAVDRAWKRAQALHRDRRPIEDATFVVTHDEYRQMLMDQQTVIGPLNSSLGTDDERIFGMRLVCRDD